MALFGPRAPAESLHKTVSIIAWGPAFAQEGASRRAPLWQAKGSVALVTHVSDGRYCI